MSTTARKHLVFVLEDAPYENERTITGLRLVNASLNRGHDVTVFAYEGAVSHTFSRQERHANAVHGNDVEHEDHPLPRRLVAELLELASLKGVTLDWINCGLCVTERGVDEAIPGVRKGSPVDLWRATEAATNSLVIATR